MLQLRTWTGWRRIVAQFEDAGYGLIGQFSRLASELCGSRFTAESFQTEQCEQGEKYVNHLFGERLPPTQGELRRQLQQVLARLSEADRLARFERPLYALREAEIISTPDDGVEIAKRKDTQRYLDLVGSQLGFTVEKRFSGRQVCKTYEGWLRGVAAVDTDRIERLSLSVVELALKIELIGSTPAVTEVVAPGEVAEAVLFYQLVAPPRSMREPPQTPDARVISEMAKHGVRAQLRFFDLLMNDLAENGRA